MVHLRIVVPSRRPEKVLGLLEARPRSPTWSSSPGAARKPERRRGPLRHRPRGSQRPDRGPEGARRSRGTARSRSSRSTRRSPTPPTGPSGRRAGALGRGRLGGGRGAHLGDHRAGRQLPRLHGPRLPDRLGRDLPRLADPDRRGDGRRARVRPARRASAWRWSSGAATSPCARSRRSPIGFPVGITAAFLFTLFCQGDRPARRRLQQLDAPADRSSSPNPTTSPSSSPASPAPPACSRSPRPSRGRWSAC